MSFFTKDLYVLLIVDFFKFVLCNYFLNWLNIAQILTTGPDIEYEYIFGLSKYEKHELIN